MEPAIVIILVVIACCCIAGAIAKSARGQQPTPIEDRPTPVCPKDPPAPAPSKLPTPTPLKPSSPSQHPRERAIAMMLIRIIDGDTIWAVDGDGASVRIRLLGIDAPEEGQPGCYHSKFRLAELIGSTRKMTVMARDQDCYGRMLATIINDQGVNICRQMVADGMAHATTYCDNLDINYEAVEAVAKAQKYGIWALPDAGRIKPADYRRRKFYV